MPTERVARPRLPLWTGPVNATNAVTGWMCCSCGVRHAAPKTTYDAVTPRGVPIQLCDDCFASIKAAGGE